MIGIVVVSHSWQLAEAAVALATEMTPAGVKVVAAGGLDEHTFGTDAARIAEAVTMADTGKGVLVLVDLGSAVLSAEMACEFIDSDLAQRVRISSAPLVEGLISAVVTAGINGNLDDVAAEAERGLAAKQEHLGGVQTVAASAAQAPVEVGSAREFLITNEHGLHARPAAVLVNGLRGFDAEVWLQNATGTQANAHSVTSIATLGLIKGSKFAATAYGAQADQALNALAEMVDSEFGEKQELRSAVEPATEPAAVTPETDARKSTGQEIVIGPAHRLCTDIDISNYQPGDPEQESERYLAAVSQVRAYLEGLAGHRAKEIAAAQLEILGDCEVQKNISQAIQQGTPAPAALSQVWSVVEQHFSLLSDPYQRERAADIRSLTRLQLLTLTGQPLYQTQLAGIIVVDELDAALAATLPAEVLGVVTTTGGATGHGVIVATSRGIPVVTGQSQADAIADGTTVALDPRTQELFIDPDQVCLNQLHDRQLMRASEAEQAEAAKAEPAFTRDGARVYVEANIASLADAQVGARAGAEGSGLVRTEILFADSISAPSIDEQAACFVELGKTLGGTLTIRTWDVGADKPLAFIPQDPEPNPFLGERGIRTMRRHPDIFDTQLEAICQAGREVSTQVLLPMVTNTEEVRWARAHLADVADKLGVAAPPLGIMIEIPAAAIRAQDFAGLIDFVSVGTNDLTQYVCAADRGNAQVSDLASPGNTAVLDLIGGLAEKLPGVPIAVCGDLASNLRIVPALVCCGVTQLSVRPPLVGLVKQVVRTS